MSTDDDDTVHLERLSLANSATSSDLATAPEYSGPHTPLKLVRNGKVDTPNDYAHIFTKLQLEGNFQEEFFETMKEYRSRADVKEALEDPENDLKAISEDFLKTYGKKIWMLRGANNKQDPKYRETFFKWKDDEDKSGPPIAIVVFSQSVSLDELWTRVRQLLWDRASESTLSIQSSRSRQPSEKSSTISSMDAEEEAMAVEFINKVRAEVHGLPGSTRPRKHFIKSIEED